MLILSSYTGLDVSYQGGSGGSDGSDGSGGFEQFLLCSPTESFLYIVSQAAIDESRVSANLVFISFLGVDMRSCMRFVS